MTPDPPELDLAAWLLTRDEVLGAWAGPTRLKRLGGGGEAGFRAAEPGLSLDRGRMRLHGVCTSERMDRSREIVRAKGLDVGDHRLNPIFTVGHRWREADGVVARCEVAGEYAVRPGQGDGNSTPFAAQFFQSGPAAERSEQAFAMADAGVLKGISVGFLIPPDGTRRVTAPDGHPALEITRSSLFEVTLLPVGDNPDAVVRVVEKGLGGRPLLPEYAALLTPFVPAPRYVRGGWDATREKAMPDPTQPGGGAPTPAPAAQSQPQAAAPAPEPAVPPSAQYCSDLNTYLVGLLKFLKEQGARQESPAVEALAPQLQLFLSQAFRAVQSTYGQLLQKYPDLPTLPGAGSLLAVEPPPADPAGGMDQGTGGGTDPGTDPAATPPDDGGGDPYGDPGADDYGAGAGDGDLGFGDGYDDTAAPPPDDEGDEDDPDMPARQKAFRGAMRARSEAVLDAYWRSFERDLGRTDAARLARAADLAEKAARAKGWLTPAERAEGRAIASRLREKALTAETGRREAGRELDPDAVARALAPLATRVAAAGDTLYRLTGKGGD